MPLCLEDIHRPSLARPVQRSFAAFDDTTFDENAPEKCDSMMQRDYRYDVSGLQAAARSGGVFRRSPSAAACSVAATNAEWRDK
jgi:hypothetical protein